MITRDYILSTIRNHKDELFVIGVKSIGLFGSFAKEKQTARSDIDILIDFVPGKEKFDNFMAVYDFLENLFKNDKIDVVTMNGLSPHIGPEILNEVTYV